MEVVYIMQKVKLRIHRFLVLGVLAIFALIALFSCIKKVSGALNEQIQETLKDVAEQNKKIVEKDIKLKLNFLQGYSKDLTNSYKDNTEVVEHLKSYVDYFEFKRMGYIDSEGQVLTTDGKIANFKDESYFKDAMNGKTTITGVIGDVIGHSESINVLTVPVYSKEGYIEGALFAAYRTVKFSQMLNVSSFEGAGSSLLVTKDGEIFAEIGINAMGNKMDMFDYIASITSDEDLVEKVREELKEGDITEIVLKGEENTHMYFAPMDIKLGDKKCYVVTLLPENVLQDRVGNVWKHLENFLIIIVVILVVATVFTIVSYVRQSRKVIELAYSDKVTGGNNYAYFLHNMNAKKDRSGFIVAMDIDEFRIINNICGVKTGDDLLKRIWKVLKRNLKLLESHARVNADRYIMFMSEDDKEVLKERFAKITKEILNEEDLLGIPKVMPYFGVYAIDNNVSIESAYGYANQAKHIVKGNHKKNFCFYEDGDYRDRIELKKLEDGFEGAIKDRRFEVWYQPKYDAKNPHVVSAEALVRWRANDGSLIPPGKFIPLFEKNGMIATLDEYVFDEVCRRQKKWLDEGRRILPVSVNISRASLYYENVAKRYRQIVDSYGISVEYLQLEITESATIENEDIHKLVDEFHKEGFTLLLDDFGNGYSSLATLNELHFDVLKLDKSLIDYIGDKKGETLLVHIVGLARNLGLLITAEGVETKVQLDFLREIECNDIQGYYLSKPLPVNEYEAMLA